MSSMRRKRSALSARRAVELARHRRHRHRLLRAARRLARQRRDHLDRAIASDASTTATISPAICAGGDAYDWYLRKRCGRAQRADAHADHRRPRQAVDFSRQGSVELLGERALRAPRRSRARVRRPRGCRKASRSGSPKSAVRRSTRAPISRACFPTPSRPDAGLPYFSSGRRDDLIQRRFLEAVLTAFDPALRASDAGNPASSHLRRPHGRSVRRSICGPGTRGLIRVFPTAARYLERRAELGNRTLADRPARRRAARRPRLGDPRRRQGRRLRRQRARRGA